MAARIPQDGMVETRHGLWIAKPDMDQIRNSDGSTLPPLISFCVCTLLSPLLLQTWLLYSLICLSNPLPRMYLSFDTSCPILTSLYQFPSTTSVWRKVCTRPSTAHFLPRMLPDLFSSSSTLFLIKIPASVVSCICHLLTIPIDSRKGYLGSSFLSPPL